MASGTKLSSKSNRRRELECAVCLDRLCQPRMLSCFHNFCANCLENLIEGQTISCPTCRQNTTLGSGGVGDLPKNISLLNIMDTLCERCFYDDREVLCDDCTMWLCSRCNDRCKQKHDLTNEIKTMKKDLIKYEQQTIEQRSKLTNSAASVMDQIDICEKEMIKNIRLNARRLKDEVQQQLDKQLDVLDKLTSTIQGLKKEISEFLQKKLQVDDSTDLEIKCVPAQWSEILTTTAEGLLKGKCSIEFVLDKTEPSIGQLVVSLESSPEQSPVSTTTCAGELATSELVQQPEIDYKNAKFDNFTFVPYGSDYKNKIKPSYVAISPVTKNLIVLGKKIQLYNEKFEFISNVVLCFSHDCLAVTDTGLIVIADTSRHRLKVFTEDGEHVRYIGQQGSLPGQFNSPKGLFVHNDLIYICDTSNHRIQVLEMGGEFVREFGSDILGLATPNAITVLKNRDVVVASYCYKGQGIYESKLLLFSPDGSFKSCFATGVRGELKLYEPCGVTSDNAGHIIVSDAYTHNIHFLSASGKLLRTRGCYGRALGQLDSPMGLVCTHDGQIVVADMSNDRIQVFSAKNP